MHFVSKVLVLTIFILFVSFCTVMTASAAPKSDLWPHWLTNDPQSSTKIDHSVWASFLDTYLIQGKAGSANLIRYGTVQSVDKEYLAKYIAALSGVTVTRLHRKEQKAFWINLYNALTVHTILTHYPVKSIRDIGSGFFSSGPWDSQMIKVEGRKISLNDIEHRILRPIWQDNRVHYAVNCASLGCPDLQPVPFRADNSEQLLERAARGFVNSYRGVTFIDDRLTLSSIYDWFQVDFGDSDPAIIEHLLTFASPPLAVKLNQYRGEISYRYNWSLNEL